jgi:hypothetical protein
MDLKVAVLIQGEPRFCQEFDFFLENLVGYDQVDWFFYLWKTSGSVQTVQGTDGHVLVADPWQNIDLNWAIGKLQSNLPENHYVAGIELADQHTLPIPIIKRRMACHSVANVWKMWHSQYRANQMRLAYEKENDVSYDVVIRTRPDVALLDTVDARVVNDHLVKKANMVIIPKNKLVGETIERVTCDLMGISNPQSMTTYTDLINHALDYNRLGEEFHPENLLACHLKKQGLDTSIANFNIEMRWLGQWQNIHTGEMVPVHKIKDLTDFRYTSQFGRWE